MKNICCKCGVKKEVLFYENVGGFIKHICNNCLKLENKIGWIKNRIDAEFKKHYQVAPTPNKIDWSRIAEAKIISTIDTIITEWYKKMMLKKVLPLEEWYSSETISGQELEGLKEQIKGLLK